MSTSVRTLSAWFDEGVALNATHMIVVVDEYDHDDYPVYVTAGQSVRAVFDEYAAKPMQRVMEVYNLGMNKDVQMREVRAFHLDPA